MAHIDAGKTTATEHFVLHGYSHKIGSSRRNRHHGLDGAEQERYYNYPGCHHLFLDA